ncbi:MAG: hypothetical protein ACP5KB_00330 [Thermoprotei archaeon]
MSRGENLKVVMGFLDKSLLSYVLPQQCLKAFLDRIPEELRELLGSPVTLNEVFISVECLPLTGVVIHGRTPTSEQGTYVEVYKGFLPPLPSFTPAQCVADLEGDIIGCRYLLQKKYVNSSCEERDLHNQISKDELSEHVMRLLKSLSSTGLWLYIVDCKEKLTLVKVHDKIT